MLEFVDDIAKKSSLIYANDWGNFYNYLQAEWNKIEGIYLDKSQVLAEMIFSIERRLK